jgi:hypothetical protein
MDRIARLLLFALTELRPAQRLSAGASRITAAAVYSAAAVAATAAALICLIAAGWITLIPLIGHAGAAVCAALGLFVVAAVLWVLARNRIGLEAETVDVPPPDPVLPGLAAGVQAAAEQIGPEVRRLFAENKLPIILAAVVAGMALASDRDERR